MAQQTLVIAPFSNTLLELKRLQDPSQISLLMFKFQPTLPKVALIEILKHLQ